MLIVVMGVTGSGKSTLAARLAARLGVPFHDADDFHPPENRAKMAKNIPLEDADRWPWLERMARESELWEASGGAVLACSALKQRYRDVLSSRVASARFVYLKMTRELIAARLEQRRGQHAFIGAFDRVLAGQFRDLEEPADAITLSEPGSVEELSEAAFSELRRAGYVGNSPLDFARGASDATLGQPDVDELLDRVLARVGPLRRALLVPDVTRSDCGVTELTGQLFQRLQRCAEVSVLPAVGRQSGMSDPPIARQFPSIPGERFLRHDFRSGVAPLGEVPAGFVRRVSANRVDFSICCELSRELLLGGWDRIFSIGELVPHELAGIAGHDENVFIGVGGKHTIERSHFLSAVCGIEAILARPHTPVRDVLSYMSGQLAAALPITHLLSVRGRPANGELVTRGLFAGDGARCFEAGAPLARDCNLELLATAPAKIVVYLDPDAYRSTWLANQAIDRTRLALADGGELLLIAPGVGRFGQDEQSDSLIRRHGYRGTAATLAGVASDAELESALELAAHLIRGSTEGRFRVRYAAGGLSQADVEGVGYEYAEPAATLARYNPGALRPGLNRLADGEEIFFIHNPGPGLWTTRERFTAAKAC